MHQEDSYDVAYSKPAFKTTCTHIQNYRNASAEEFRQNLFVKGFASRVTAYATLGGVYIAVK